MKRLLPLLALVVAQAASAATCKISEYSNLVLDANNRQVPVALEPAITTQSVTYTTSTSSVAFNDDTRFVRIICDAKAHFVFTTATPTLTNSYPYLPADTAEYFGIERAPRGTSQTLTVRFYDGSS